MSKEAYIKELEDRCEHLQEKLSLLENQVKLSAVVYSNGEDNDYFATVYAYVRYKITKDNTNTWWGNSCKEVVLLAVNKFGKKWQILYGVDVDNMKIIKGKHTETEYLEKCTIKDAITYGVKKAGYDAMSCEIIERTLP